MRVGATLGSSFGLSSLVRIAKTTYRALAEGHELVHLPHAYPYASAPERERMAGEFLRGCDVVVGLLDPFLLACRARGGGGAPYLFFTHGELPAGGWGVKEAM